LLEARVEVFLLNVMGSAAIASAVIVGVLTTRLSRELAGMTGSRPDPARDALRRPRPDL